MSSTTGKHVTYVGAGPGDPELLSLRAVELLQEADLVVHDQAVPSEVLEYCRSSAVVRAAHLSENPTGSEFAELAQLLIDSAREGRRTVRLKAGDPLFFSRALEEISHLRKAGIAVELLPGIASPLGASAYAGIPMTQGSGAASVLFVTANRAVESLRELPEGIDTIAILGPLTDLRPVMADLCRMARYAKRAAALVSRATLPEQSVLAGKLEELASLCTSLPQRDPAILIITTLLDSQLRLNWFEQKPLLGRRLLLCRPLHQAQQSAQLIRRRGARPVLMPLIEIGPPSDPLALEHAAAHLTQYDWVILTSANGVKALFDAIVRGGRDVRAFGTTKIAVIGPGTAKPLKSWGLSPDLIAEEHVAEGLARELLALGRAQSAILVRAEEARDVLPTTLRQAGFTVDVVPAYQTRSLAAAQRTRLLDSLASNSLDAVLLTSSSMAESLVSAIGAEAADVLSKTCVASIGPITTATLRRLGVRVNVEARQFTVEGLLDAIEEHWQETGFQAG